MALENAYQSQFLLSVDTAGLAADLEIARSVNQTEAVSDEVHILLTTSDIKPFPLPVIVDDIVYIDGRRFSTVDATGKLKIKDPIEANMRVDLARWYLAWQRSAGNHARILTQMPDFYLLYTKWVADNLAHVNSLSPYQCDQLRALTALFAVGQFFNNFKTDVEMWRMQEVVARELNINIEVFESVTGHTEFLFPRNIDEFVEMVNRSGISARLDEKSFSRVTLIQLLSNSVYGFQDNTQLCTSAIEFPPSFLAMVKVAVGNNMLNRSKVGAVVKDVLGRRVNVFADTYDRVLGQFTKPARVF